MDTAKIIGVVGPTATGKSAVSLNLARQYGAEIVCADSVTAFRGLNIGSAKPSLAEQAEIPHHLLDICDPDHTLTVAEFVAHGRTAIDTIHSRNKPVIVVGGSGLYINALLYGYEFRDTSQQTKYQREELEALSVEDLQVLLDQDYPGLLNESDRYNSRRIIQTLLYGPPHKTNLSEPQYDSLLFGLDTSDDVLKTSISNRTDTMLTDGMVEEVEGLIAKYGSAIQSLKSVGYRQVVEYLEGNLERNLPDEINQATWQLVRKQRTWFRKNQSIKWVKDKSAIVTALSKSGYNI